MDVALCPIIAWGRRKCGIAFGFSGPQARVALFPMIASVGVGANVDVALCPIIAPVGVGGNME